MVVFIWTNSWISYNGLRNLFTENIRYMAGEKYMTLLTFLSRSRSQLEERGLSPQEIVEDVVNYWYFKHYKQVLFPKMNNEGYGTLLKELCPKTDDPDEFWQEITQVLKQII